MPRLLAPALCAAAAAAALAPTAFAAAQVPPPSRFVAGLPPATTAQQQRNSATAAADAAHAKAFFPATRRARFNVIDASCNNAVTSIAKGQETVLASLTDETVYDKRKRPETAPITVGPLVGRAVSTDADITRLWIQVCAPLSYFSHHHHPLFAFSSFAVTSHAS